LKSINDIQNEIVQEFELLEGDRESTIYYIMELGARLDPLPEKDKLDKNLIKGCQSKVWLITKPDEDTVVFNADSNTEITKGLISMLIRVLSGQKASEIIDADLSFVDRIGISSIIGSQRSNGLLSMIKQMKLYALAYSQLNSKSKNSDSKQIPISKSK